jgi:predicted kinase
MQDCPQEPEYHAEGDVWTHTRMVVDCLLAESAYADLKVEEQTIMLHAAILHDVAKPACTVIENGQIRSPRHAVVGERLAREILWDHDFNYREKVCALVRLHGLPVWGINRANPARAAILASWRARNELTYLLSKADMLGRISQAQAEHLYQVEIFRELCLENECFYQERPWHDAYSRFQYFWSEETYPVPLFDESKFEVFLMAGIAGSGKDSYVSKHFAHLPQVSLDELRRELKIAPDDRKGQGVVAQAAYQRAKEYCRRQQPFVWNSTNLSNELRARLIQTLRVYQPRFTLTYVETSQENILKRRAGDIKAKVLWKMIEGLDFPLPGEAQEVVYVRN